MNPLAVITAILSVVLVIDARELGKKPPYLVKKATTLSPTPAQLEKLPIDCLNLFGGSYPDPSKKCSNIYYVCSNGQGSKHECPPNLYFDNQTKLCNWYEEISACTGKRKPPTKATPPPVPSPASLPSKEYDCSKKNDGSYLPESKKCSHHWFSCVGGVAYKRQCSENLYYNIEDDSCQSWIDVFGCSGKRRTSPKPTTTTTTPKPTTAEKLPIDCGKLADGDYVDPEKKCSNIYYTCSNYIGARRLCPQGTYFDKNYLYCDAREYVVDCGGTRRPAYPSTVKLPIPPKVAYDCEKLSDGNYPAGKCDKKFYT